MTVNQTWCKLNRIALVACAAGTLNVSLCFTGETAREFRQVALPGLGVGVTSLMGGLFSGDASGAASDGLESILGAVVNGLVASATPDGA